MNGPLCRRSQRTYHAGIAATRAGYRCLFSRDPSGYGRLAQRALFVREDAHEVREASDVEDLDVMIAQAIGQEAALRSTRLGKQARNQEDPGQIGRASCRERV